MSNHEYQVIIVGGGPVGVALGIELGLNNIKTLILEKHSQPLHTPRAQSLSARTMEFFLRWGIDKTLEDNMLLPKNLPQTGIWCTNMTGETYFTGCWGDNQLDENTSPKAGVRIPLWVTEDVLRNRLTELPTVDFLRDHEVQDVVTTPDSITVFSVDKTSGLIKKYQANFLACCDGAGGISKDKLNNSFNILSDKTKMLGVSFFSKDFMVKKTVADGIMYFILSDGAMSFVGPINLNEGLWFAQIIWDPSSTPDEPTLSKIIDKIMGVSVNKTILGHYFWDMQVKIADFFSLDNRIFWLGDAAHAFAPTGGLGLNTGFGDAENLGWKLASVINGKVSVELLSTYEKERRPVCMNNLNFAKKNAEEFIEVKKKFPPNENYKAFALAYADLGNRFLCSSGLTLGYVYLDSPLTRLSAAQMKETLTDDPFKYTPRSEPGYFLPHTLYQNAPIYEKLSSTDWNLVICGKMKNNPKILYQMLSIDRINILEMDENTYPYPFILIRPDWHIARVGNTLESIAGSIFTEYFKDLVLS